MRVLRTSMVVLALWGFLAPRVVACCCPKTSVNAHRAQADHAGSSDEHAAAPVRSCCHGGESAPSESETPCSEQPDSKHDSKGCQGCNCGMFCCGKQVVPPPHVVQYAAPAPVDALTIVSDSLPSSVALSPILRPPRQS